MGGRGLPRKNEQQAGDGRDGQQNGDGWVRRMGNGKEVIYQEGWAMGGRG